MTITTDEDWLALLRRSAAGQRSYLDGQPLPAMPETELQLRTVGQAGPDTIDEAWAFAEACLARFRTSTCFQNGHKTLLDFGTGWGRIARCFLRDFRADDVAGADVDDDLVSVCRSTFPGPHFLRCSPMPPLALGDGTIDFVVAYSVFSHLSEAACRAWMTEFGRLLKPGGMIAVTTRGRWFFDYAASLAGGDAYAQALARMFPDFNEAKARYDGGEFVHSNSGGVTGGGALDGSFYGETFIPERFAREVLGRTPSLRLIEFHAGEGHPILFFQKAMLE